MPGYVGFYVSQTEGEDASLGGSLTRGLIAGGGVLVTLAALFGLAFWVGHSTISNVVLFEPIAGALLLIFGVLVVLGRAPSLSVALPKRRSSVFGFGIFGGTRWPRRAVSPAVRRGRRQRAHVSAGDGRARRRNLRRERHALMVSLTVATGMGLVASTGKIMAYSDHLERLAGVVMILAGIGQLYLAVVVLDVI